MQPVSTLSPLVMIASVTSVMLVSNWTSMLRTLHVVSLFLFLSVSPHLSLSFWHSVISDHSSLPTFLFSHCRLRSNPWTLPGPQPTRASRYTLVCCGRARGNDVNQLSLQVMVGGRVGSIVMVMGILTLALTAPRRPTVSGINVPTPPTYHR